MQPKITYWLHLAALLDEVFLKSATLLVLLLVVALSALLGDTN